MKSIPVVTCIAITQLIFGWSEGLQAFGKLESEAALTNHKTYAWITRFDSDGKSREDDEVFASLIREQADGGEVLPKEYAEEMLAFERFDTKTKKVLWRGWASKPLSAKSNIKHAVRDIFSRLQIRHKE
jgi:hypothetical protein